MAEEEAATVMPNTGWKRRCQCDIVSRPATTIYTDPFNVYVYMPVKSIRLSRSSACAANHGCSLLKTEMGKAIVWHTSICFLHL